MPLSKLKRIAETDTRSRCERWGHLYRVDSRNGAPVSVFCEECGLKWRVGGEPS